MEHKCVTPYLQTEVGCCCSDESERCSDMDLLDDIPSVVRSCVQHAVISEAGVVDDVVYLAVLPTRLVMVSQSLA